MESKTSATKTSGRRYRGRGASGRKSPPGSPVRSFASPHSAAEVLTEEDLAVFENLDISVEDKPNPRSFPHGVKQQCWEKAEKIKGRDPDRWRRDHLGNIVFRKLVGCPGCLCHDYDHIIPYSKGGKSTLDNCQVLQRYPEVISLRGVLTAVFQGVIWTLSSSQLTEMCTTTLMRERDVGFNDHVEVTNC